jgi:hypothetical protein
MAGGSRVLPVWHGVDQNEVAAFSPTLADTFAANSDGSFDVLALRIAQVIKPDLHRAILRKIAHAEAIRDAIGTETSIASIQHGPIRHQKLPRKLTNRIELIAAALSEVEPKALNDWLDGFQRDVTPLQEIEVWEEIASRYQRAQNQRSMTISQKKAVSSALLIASLGGLIEAGEMLIKAFGHDADAVVNSMVFDINSFSKISNQDAELNKIMNFEIESYSISEYQIDLDYIDQLVADFTIYKK